MHDFAQDGWTSTTLGQLAEVRGGKRLPAGFRLQAQATQFPYIRVSDMFDGGVDESDLRYVPENAAQAIKNYRISSSDIFISVAGTLGIVGRVSSRLDGANLTENADRLTNIRCDIDFLMYYLLSQPIQKEIDAIRTVGAQPKLALGRIKSFGVTLPNSIVEQANVSRVLRDVDALIGSLERVIAKKQAINQGMMQQLLTGKTRLPGFTDDWIGLDVAENSHLKARIGWQGLSVGEYRDVGEYRLIGGTNFANGRVDWSSTPFVDKWRFDQDSNIQVRNGDILITKDGSIGKVAFVEDLPGPSTLNSGVFVLRPKNGAYDSGFLYFLFRSRAFDEFVSRLSAGSTISHLYQRDLAKLSFDVPPSLAEQKAIFNALLDVDAELTLLQKRLESTRDIKRGMMQELLTGRTRLTPVGA